MGEKMIRVFFGSPGVGKTTLCVKQAKRQLKHYDYTFTNFPQTVPGSSVVDLAGLGNWTFPDHSYIAIDEAGIEYNNRKFKTLPQETIRWYKKHRHYKCDVDVFSQGWDDMDITLRRLANELWCMYKFGPFTLCRRVYKKVEVDQNTHQIIDGYKLANMLWLLIWPLQLGWPFDKKLTVTYRPFYYKYFDSWDKDHIPVCDFKINQRKPRRRLDRRGLREKISTGAATLQCQIRSKFMDLIKKFSH